MRIQSAIVVQMTRDKMTRDKMTIKNNAIKKICSNSIVHILCLKKHLSNRFQHVCCSIY